MAGPMKVTSMSCDQSDEVMQDYLDHQHFPGDLPDSLPPDDEMFLEPMDVG